MHTVSTLTVVNLINRSSRLRTSKEVFRVLRFLFCFFDVEITRIFSALPSAFQRGADDPDPISGCITRCATWSPRRSSFVGTPREPGTQRLPSRHVELMCRRMTKADFQDSASISRKRRRGLPPLSGPDRFGRPRAVSGLGCLCWLAMGTEASLEPIPAHLRGP